MKRALILHGFFDNSKMYWFRKEKELLEKHGYEVSLPDLPNSFIPKRGSWLKVIEDFAPDEESVLMGFSLGGTTIIKYLEQTEEPIYAAILLATPIGFPEKPKGTKLRVQSLLTNLLLDLSGYSKEYHWEKISKMARKFILIYKKGDPKVCPAQGKVLAKNIGGKLYMLRGNDHMHLLSDAILNKDINSEC